VIVENENLETFYVYRSLHSDESWGAIVASSTINKLPNADFCMKVFARNPKEAIARARNLYEKLHKYDNSKKNIRYFTAAALRPITEGLVNSKDGFTSIERNADIAVRIAIATNEAYNKYFQELEDDDLNSE
jgi:ribonucleotide reductase alpha subunit